MSKILPELVKTFRERAGLSQAELGQRMGLPQTRISDIEHGRRAVRADELARLAGACDLTAGEWTALRKQLAA